MTTVGKAGPGNWFPTRQDAGKTPSMTQAALPVAPDTAEIARFCRSRGIRRLALFGSVLRDDLTPSSDDVYRARMIGHRIGGLST